MALVYTEINRNKTKTFLLLTFFTLFVMLAGFSIAEMYQPGNGMGGLMIAAVISFVWTLFSYFNGDKVALKSSQAKPITKRQYPELWRMVENLSIMAGLPMPKVHVIHSEALNAFATGRDPEHASIAVTTGLMDRLEKKELQGVLAHELSHIGNYDIRVMTIAMALAGVIMIMTDFFWRMTFWGGGRSNNGNGGKGNPVLLIVGIAMLILAPIVSSLIKLAVSRRREYLADASGALLTRYPEGLAGALEKIGGDKHKLRTASKGTAHLFISNPFKKGSWSKLFSTHPPIEDRIAKLRGMDV